MNSLVLVWMFWFGFVVCCISALRLGFVLWDVVRSSSWSSCFDPSRSALDVSPFSPRVKTLPPLSLLEIKVMRFLWDNPGENFEDVLVNMRASHETGLCGLCSSKVYDAPTGNGGLCQECFFDVCDFVSTSDSRAGAPSTSVCPGCGMEFFDSALDGCGLCERCSF